MRKLRLIKPWRLKTLRQITFNERFIYEARQLATVPCNGPDRDNGSISIDELSRTRPSGSPASRIIYHFNSGSRL